MHSMTFKIRGLDCAEEVTVLQRALGPLVGGEANLAFDILNGTMTVRPGAGDSKRGSSTAGRRPHRDAGLPWQESSATARAETFWQRHGRTILCIASGLLLASGFLWHALRHGSLLDALAAGDSGGHAFPLVSILLYLGAVVSGAWFIAPKASMRLDFQTRHEPPDDGGGRRRHRHWRMVRGRDGDVSLCPGAAPGILERRARSPGDQGVSGTLAAHGPLHRSRNRAVIEKPVASRSPSGRLSWSDQAKRSPWTAW